MPLEFASRIQRLLPFSRLESSTWELLASLRHIRNPGAIQQFRNAIRELTGAADVLMAPSCRSAIAQILTLLPHEEVLLPAYTCSVVKTAIELAGKRIIYLEPAKNSLNATSAQFAEKIRPRTVLLPTHVYGIPTDIENIRALARAHGCVTIEDVAGGFGLRHNGFWLGTFGDFGVFSFERTKRLPAFRGAAILVNNHKLLDSAKLAAQRFASTVSTFPWRDFTFALAQNVAMHPWIYTYLQSAGKLRRSLKKNLVVQTKNPEIPLNTPFYSREFHPYQAALLLRMLRRMDRIRDHIAQLALVYRDVFRNSPVQTFLGDSDFDLGGLLRFPVAFPGRDRSEILRLARQRGIILETNFEEFLPDPSERPHFPNAIWAAQNVILLPLYASLSPADAHRIATELIAIARRPSSVDVALAGTRHSPPRPSFAGQAP